ncbi:hypothetical protein QP166_11770 [Sphingomonas sp. LR60]|uniref:hypothetical protein n=1 Tax=Sphingomonas sp. LR60 TaxID=3050233 RepID=UPI002FDFA617
MGPDPKTWLTGVSGIAEALADPDRNWTNFLARTAGAVAVPAFAAQVTRTIDPVIREARSPIDRIRSRTPGVSDDLFPRRNIFGEPVTSGGGLGPDIVSPVWTGEAKNNPTIKALLDAGVTVSVPPRFRKVDGKRKEWTPAEYDRLQVAVGDRAREGLSRLVKSDGWKSADDEAKQSMVSDLMRDARKAAREQVEGVTRRAPDQARTTPALPADSRFAPMKGLPALPPGLMLDR